MISCGSLIGYFGAPIYIVQAIGLIALFGASAFFLGGKKVGSWVVPRVSKWTSAFSALVLLLVFVSHVPLLDPPPCSASDWNRKWCGASNGVVSETWFSVACDCEVTGNFSNQDGTPNGNLGTFKGVAKGVMMHGTFEGREAGTFRFKLGEDGTSWDGIYIFKNGPELPWDGKPCKIVE